MQKRFISRRKHEYWVCIAYVTFYIRCSRKFAPSNKSTSLQCDNEISSVALHFRLQYMNIRPSEEVCKVESNECLIQGDAI